MKDHPKFLPCGTDLVAGRVKRDGPVVARVQDEMEALVIRSGILDTALFEWVGLMYRYGTKNDLKLVYDGRISKKYGDIPLAVELKMEIMEWADKHNLDLLYDAHMIASLEAMIQVCKKYKLPDTVFVEERKKFKTIPDSIEECVANYPKNTTWSHLYK